MFWGTVCRLWLHCRAGQVHLWSVFACTRVGPQATKGAVKVLSTLRTVFCALCTEYSGGVGCPSGWGPRQGGLGRWDPSVVSPPGRWLQGRMQGEGLVGAGGLGASGGPGRKFGGVRGNKMPLIQGHRWPRARYVWDTALKPRHEAAAGWPTAWLQLAKESAVSPGSPLPLVPRLG